MYSPLEQFELFLLQPLSMFGIDISLTTMVVYMSLNFLVLIFFFMVTLRYRFVVGHFYQKLLEVLYKALYSMIIENLTKKGSVYFPLFITVFFFVLFSNLIGLIPYNFTVTSHFAITFSLAFSLNLGFLILGVYLYQQDFFMIFIPSGVPVFFIPLITTIEVISYLLRTISLSVRLFANMTAGHILLFIILSFITFLIKSGFAFFSIIPLILLIAIYVLETAIAFIQAYVFLIMICLYLKETLFV